ncbi:hypothetical protein CS063_00850 [Sporanaerobium hydrogeniformans]|uniref:Uncharacterized protein n=1 Tax=Sporanaerobium hydrogeniformans TaxID=3072179 RepID=A0AC61DFP4_9FIRM|nr:hypothetical protein [Sporanaerobium hydrogeniformans]PHV72059.1 hypothetical protein CS063_00850 [Sporanaerobium hydrogeniformans]
MLRIKQPSLKYKVYFYFLFFLSLYMLCIFGVRKSGYTVPHAMRQDLLTVLSNQTFNEADYALIYEQTGLAAPIVNELKKHSAFEQKLLEFQENFFKKVKLADRPLNLVTKEDYLLNEKGLAYAHFEIAPYKNGDIFLTKSTHTLGWRHGHCGLVVDEKRGKTLEAFSPGTISSENDANRWRYYPTFKMLRVINITSEQKQEVVNYALTHLNGIPYGILASKEQGQTPQKTHCSLLIWQSFYYTLGIDLDSNKGYFVSPENIAKSSLLETLQFIGFSAKKEW